MDFNLMYHGHGMNQNCFNQIM